MRIADGGEGGASKGRRPEILRLGGLPDPAQIAHLSENV